MKSWCRYDKEKYAFGPSVWNFINLKRLNSCSKAYWKKELIGWNKESFVCLIGTHFLAHHRSHLLFPIFVFLLSDCKIYSPSHICSISFKELHNKIKKKTKYSSHKINSLIGKYKKVTCRPCLCCLMGGLCGKDRIRNSSRRKLFSN